jgi:hypothetical protein
LTSTFSARPKITFGSSSVPRPFSKIFSDPAASRSPAHLYILDVLENRAGNAVAILIFWPQSVTYWIARRPVVDPSTIRIEIALPDFEPPPIELDLPR